MSYDQKLALANMTVSDGVSPLPKGRGERSRLGPPLNPPLPNAAALPDNL